MYLLRWRTEGQFIDRGRENEMPIRAQFSTWIILFFINSDLRSHCSRGATNLVYQIGNTTETSFIIKILFPAYGIPVIPIIPVASNTCCNDTCNTCNTCCKTKCKSSGNLQGHSKMIFLAKAMLKNIAVLKNLSLWINLFRQWTGNILFCINIFVFSRSTLIYLLLTITIVCSWNI